MAEPYQPAEEVFRDADGRIGTAKALAECFEPIEGTPAETYLVQTRRIPAKAVQGCPDLRYLPPPIADRPPQDHALVSLLRDPADGAVTGFQLELCDITGARTGTEPTKQAYALRKHGVRDGLFYAGGSGATAFLAEGCSTKPLALASLDLGGAVYGGGGLHVLGYAIPPERRVVLVPDRAPPPNKWTADGKERLLDQHEAAYARALDRLILAKCDVTIAAAPDCAQHAACKDADAYLRQHGALRLKELLGRTVPGALSREGEIRRLAAIESELDRAAAIKAAWKDREVLHGIPIGLLHEHVEKARQEAQLSAIKAPVGTEPWDDTQSVSSCSAEPSIKSVSSGCNLPLSGSSIDTFTAP